MFGEFRRVMAMSLRRKLMADPTQSITKGFTVFRSAAEEAEIKKVRERRGNEGGHMSCISGRIVRVNGTGKPFKAIMSQEGSRTIEREFATMREAEAFVRQNTPRGVERSTLYDRGPNNS